MGSNSSKLEENIKENKRTINRTIRSLERQKLASEREEESLKLKIKAEARAGRMHNAKLLARDVLRNKKMADHYCNMRSQMMALQSQLQAAHNTNKISNSLKNVSELMSQVNCSTNVTEFYKIMNNIAKQAEVLNLKLEMMEDTMETAFIDESNALEEKAVNQLLNELGIDANTPPEPNKTGQSELKSPAIAGTEEENSLKQIELKNEMLKIEERVNNLKK